MARISPDLENFDILSIDLNSGRSFFYCSAYPRLLDAVSAFRDSNNGYGIIAAAHIAYGWMPTALREVSLEGFAPLGARPLEAIRATERATDLLTELGERSPVNGSWVGLSKLLHFLNPHNFPIWDSRVAVHFGLHYSTALNKRSQYLRYCEWVTQNLSHPLVLDMQGKFYLLFNYKISEVRALELILFSSKPRTKDLVT